MLNRPQEILFVTNEGAVQKNGFSATLGKGQFGIVDKGAAKSALGEKVTTTLPTTPKDRLFELALGASDLKPNRSQTNKSWRSLPFKLSDVVEIKVKTPVGKGSVDEVLIGYDGINADTALVFENGDNETLDITLKGDALGMLGYKDGKVTVKLHLRAPNEGAFTMQQIVEEGVEVLKKMNLMGVPITEYIDITPINSTQTALTGSDYSFFYLSVNDEGRESDKGLIQAEYHLFKVERKSWKDGLSVYSILAPSATVLADYEATLTDIMKYCEACPDGFTASADGKLCVNDGIPVAIAWAEGETGVVVSESYDIQLADDECGTNRLAELQAAYPSLTIAVKGTSKRTVTLTGTSGTANVAIAGTNYLATFATDLTTTANNFVTAHAATILAATGATVTAAAGVITITDTNLGFPTVTITNATTNLAGTVGALTAVTTTEGGCQTVYTTTVLSNPVFDECDPILLDLYFTEAPSAYNFTHWTKATKVYNEDALMGIRVKGKMNIFAGSEEYRFDIPNIYDSTRISVSSEVGMVNESYKQGRVGRFAVKMLSVASKPDSLGMDLRDLENRARIHYTMSPVHEDNNIARYLLGEESLLKPTAQYVTYNIWIRTSKIAGMFSKEEVTNQKYIIAAEVGRHLGVEDVVNALATAAGVPVVEAFNY
jgi:hypothetical protein